MLSPDDLVPVQEALRPPEGHRLDVAVGTTYSLDLLALLAAPVAFAMFEIRDSSDPQALSGLAVLEAVRRYADATTVFCQAGQIAVPAKYSQALTWTEGGVVEVKRPSPSGVFHPKTWALRFTDDDGSTRHRFVVLSRNLTFDRSWDVVVVLDEDPECAAEPAADAGAFVRSLPSLAARPMHPARVDSVMDLADTLSRARLAPPKPFRSAQVWPVGGPADRGWPYPPDPRRVVVVSPFLTGSALAKITGDARAVLVSTPTAIDGLAQADRDRFDTCYVLSAVAAVPEPVPPPGTEPTQPPPVSGDTPSSGTADHAGGLHAKTVVVDLPGTPRRSRWVTGSANATHNAFHANVEVTVVLDGATGSCGTDTLLDPGTGDRDAPVLMDLLTVYEPEDNPATAEDPVADRLDVVLIDLAAAGVSLHVRPATDDGRYPVTAVLHGSIPDDLTASCRPITMPETYDHPIDPATGTATWPPLDLKSLTPYLAVTVRHPGTECQRTRVMVAHLTGAPGNRREHILADHLGTADAFLRYLLLLLGDAAQIGELGADIDKIVKGGVAGGSRSGSWSGGLPVLESLLRVAEHDPASLRHLRTLVDDLHAAGIGAEVIPPEFEAVWAAIDSAAGSLR